MKYRAEIDGLRALAVVPVILFHAGFELFSGGFVGVDVFFVISGYLITTILIEDIENNRFSIVNFYERRARRILPALFLVMLVCIPFAWVWMLPSQMKDFAQSLVAVSLFASNILFWRESGYFELTAEEKPLLHTWSLAVEEQYYVLFPVFLLFAWRSGKNRVFWLIVVMAAISLILSEWGWRKQPDANFYLAPTRAWELFAGSIAAFIVQNRGVQKSEVLSLLGLAAIIVAIFVFDETTPAPSVYTLVPVIGVVLLVLYGEKETFAAKLLSTKAFVGIGLISYSAYLWHQPLLAFVRIRFFETPSMYLMGLLSLLSLLLAVGSWKYVEEPFRNKELVSRSMVLFSSFGFACFFIVFGSVISVLPRSNLQALQLPMQAFWEGEQYAQYIKSRNMIENAQEELLTADFSECLIDLSDGQLSRIDNTQCGYERIIIVFGDSHSRDLYQSVGYELDFLPSKTLIASAHLGGCRLTENKSERCSDHYEKFKRFLRLTDIEVDRLIYVQAARNLKLEKSNELIYGEVDKLLASLLEFSPFADEVVWLGPRAGVGLEREEIALLCLDDNEALKRRLIDKFDTNVEIGRTLDRNIVEKLNSNKGIKYVSQHELLQEANFHRDFLTDCVSIFWSNPDHLSQFGEQKFSKRFLKLFE